MLLEKYCKYYQGSGEIGVQEYFKRKRVLEEVENE